jgi:methionine aminopeptidase
MVAPGVTTDQIDKAVHAMIVEAGAYPSPLNYGRFPKSVCTSVNECICHGIPDSRPLREGDIINIDVTVYLDVRGGRAGESASRRRPPCCWGVVGGDDDTARLQLDELGVLERAADCCRSLAQHRV